GRVPHQPSALASIDLDHQGRAAGGDDARQEPQAQHPRRHRAGHRTLAVPHRRARHQHRLHRVPGADPRRLPQGAGHRHRARQRQHALQPGGQALAGGPRPCPPAVRRLLQSPPQPSRAGLGRYEAAPGQLAHSDHARAHPAGARLLPLPDASPTAGHRGTVQHALATAGLRTDRSCGRLLSAGSGLSIPSSSASRATKVTPSGSLHDAYRTPRGCACSIAANIFLADASTSSTLSALTLARIMITLIGSLLLLPIPSGPRVMDRPGPCCHATCSRSSVVRGAAANSDLGTATTTTMATATTPAPTANARWYPSVNAAAAPCPSVNAAAAPCPSVNAAAAPCPSVNAAAAPCPAASRPLVRDVDSAASTARPREPPTWSSSGAARSAGPSR